MAAAARGAAAAGGLSLGIVPGVDRSQACSDLTLVVASGLGEMRNALVVQASDAVIAVGAGWGALSEVALAVRMGKPVAAVGFWTIADGGREVDGVSSARSPTEAVELAFAGLATATARG
jgi:hypothetical protein